MVHLSVATPELDLRRRLMLMSRHDDFELYRELVSITVTRSLFDFVAELDC
jgi:hypothetical protein